MKKLILLSLSILMFSSMALAFDHNHSQWTSILKVYQDKAGNVKYKQLKADWAAQKAENFRSYLSALEKVSYADYQKFSREDKMAFLINAYNAFTVKLIVDHYPVSGIKKIGGLFKKPWSIEFFSLLDGKLKALDPIEHEWLRPQFKDYRIHAAVNCASVSCPPLRSEAFVGARLGAQLDEQMKIWLQDKSRNRVELDTGVLYLSKIFDWYEKDFVDWGGGVEQVVHKYVPLQGYPGKKYQIKYLSYDWSLNEAK